MIVLCTRTGLTYASEVYHAGDFIELTGILFDEYEGLDEAAWIKKQKAAYGEVFFRLPSLSELIEALKVEKVDLVQLSKSQREQVKDYMDRRTEELERLCSEIKK